MAYSDAEKAEALIRLARNGYDFQKTADDLHLQVRTLRRWDKNVPKKSIKELLKWALARILVNPPENLSGSEWGVTVGILSDKVLLYEGQATSRSETITRKFGGMSEDEFADVIAEADQILDEASRRGAGEGDLGDPE